MLSKILNKRNKINNRKLLIVAMLLNAALLINYNYNKNEKLQYLLSGIISLILGIVLILITYLDRKEGFRAMEGFYGGWFNPLWLGIFFIIVGIYCFIVLIFDL